MKQSHIVLLLKVLAIMAWPPSAFAAVTLMQSLEGITFAVAGVLFFISTLAGLTALVLRIDREDRMYRKLAAKDPTITNLTHRLYDLKKTALAQMLGSWTSGLFFFFACEASGSGDWVELGTVLVGSFAGSRALEYASDKWLGRIFGTDNIRTGATEPGKLE